MHLLFTVYLLFFAVNLKFPFCRLAGHHDALQLEKGVRISTCQLAKNILFSSINKLCSNLFEFHHYTCSPIIERKSSFFEPVEITSTEHTQCKGHIFSNNKQSHLSLKSRAKASTGLDMLAKLQFRLAEG